MKKQQKASHIGNNKAKAKIAFELKKIFPYILTLIIGFFIVYIPNVRVVEMGSRGFEIPKVWALEQMFIILSFLTILYLVFWVLKDKKLPDFSIVKKHKELFFLFALPVLASASLIISAILSPIPETAWSGNYWRQQGASTYLVIFLSTALAALFFKHKHIKILLGAIYISSAIQVIIGFTQILGYLKNLDRLFGGFFINGGFGQTNFFSYSVATCITISIFLIWRVKLTNITNIAILSISYILLIISIFSLIFSGSTWALISLGFTFLVFVSAYSTKYLLTRLNLNTIKLKSFTLSWNQLLPRALLIVTILFFFFLPFFSNVFRIDDFRLQIWNSTRQIADSNIQRAIFGIGFDTLGEVLKEEELLIGHYVDRAHNLGLDMWLGGGFILIIILVFGTHKTVLFMDKSTVLSTLIAILTLHWIIKSSIHEFSIYNIFEFILLLALGLKLHFLNRINPE